MNDMKSFQLDITSLAFGYISDTFNKMKSFETNSIYENYRKKMVTWDGSYGTSDLPTIYESWMMVLGGIVGNDVKYTQSRIYLFNALLGQNGVNCNQFNKTCVEMSRDAFKITIDSLTLRYIKIPLWTDLHKSLFPHSLLSSTPISCVGNTEVKSMGGTDTINVGALRGSTNTNPLTADFTSTFGPVYRQIIDHSNIENSLFIGSPGQSGNILSDHYDDLASSWSVGNYFGMLTSGYKNETIQIISN
jgi:penicillin G amidase